jgi:hypothetical protein
MRCRSGKARWRTRMTAAKLPATTAKRWLERYPAGRRCCVPKNSGNSGPYYQEVSGHFGMPRWDRASPRPHLISRTVSTVARDLLCQPWAVPSADTLVIRSATTASKAPRRWRGTRSWPAGGSRVSLQNQRRADPWPLMSGQVVFQYFIPVNFAALVDRIHQA